MLLENDHKAKIFKIGLHYAWISVSWNTRLHEVVAARLGKAIWWRQDRRFKPCKGMVGSVGIQGAGGEIVHILTAALDHSSELVELAYVHEVAHVALEHYEGKYGKVSYGSIATLEEAEALAFALAFLVGKGGDNLKLKHLYQTIAEVYKEDPGFLYSEIEFMNDVAVIKDLNGIA